MLSLSIAVLSCKRPDLLKSTLRSLERNLAYPVIARYIVDCDDATSNYAVARAVHHGYISVAAAPYDNREHNILSNIQALYASVKTDLVYFTEDDWFTTRTGFIDEAVGIFERNVTVAHRVSEVVATANPTGVMELLDGVSHSGRHFDWYFSDCPGSKRKGGWPPFGYYGGWTNHPHVANVTDVLSVVGDFRRYNSEGDVTRDGMKAVIGGADGHLNPEGCARYMAFVLPAAVRHLGINRGINHGKR